MTPVMTAGRAIAPELADTAALDELRRSQYGYLDANDHVYLDYTGVGGAGGGPAG
jgi:hypothetical protein